MNWFRPKKLLLQLFTFAVTLPLFAQWEPIHPQSPIHQYFGAVVSPPNSNLLYAVGHELAVSADGGEHWTKHSNFSLPPVTPASAYWDICFTSASTAFLINENKILRTDNTGASWEAVLTLSPNNAKYAASAYFRSLMFLDEQTGFVVGDFNKIFKTTDGGNNWTQLSWDSKTIPYRALTDVYFIDENIGYIAGYQSDDILMNFGFTTFVMKTVDGGRSWQQHNIPTKWNYKHINIQFLNEREGFAHLTLSQDIDETYHTLDGGLSWTINSPATNDFRHIKAAYWNDNGKGLLYGIDHQTRVILYKTENLGQSWQTIDLPVFLYQDEDIITDIFFTDENKGIAVGAGGSILTSADGGASWTSRNKAYPYFMHFKFFDEQKGYASSGRGLFKTTEGGRSWDLVEGSVYAAIADMHLQDENNGFMTGYLGSAYTLTDGKLATTTLPVRYTYLAYMLEHQDSLIICGNAIHPDGNFLIKSGDGGKSWRTIPLKGNSSIIGLEKAGNTLFIGQTDGMSKSVDGGLTWQKLSTFSGDYLQSFTYLDANRAVGYFSLAKVCYSEDGGASWTPLAMPLEEKTAVNKFFALNSTTVYACGSVQSGRTSYGRIWKSDDAGKTWTDETPGDRIANGISDIQLVEGSLLATGGYGQFFRRSISGRQSQQITFRALPARTYMDADFKLTASASSDLPLHYSSSNTNVAQINDDVVTIVGAGESVITARQAGNDVFEAAAAAQTLTVNKKAQLITFEAPEEVALGSSPIILEAISDAALPISYSSSNTDVATIEGNVLTIKAVGETTLTASQEGNNDFNAASATQNLRIKVVTATDDPTVANVKVYPNPTDDLITIETTTPTGAAVLNIYNANGKLVKRQKYQATADGIIQVDIRQLPAGSYTIVLEDQKNTVKRFVKL